MKTIFIGLVLLAWLAPSLAGNAWSEIDTPLAESPQAIGAYNAGCLAGAAILPLQGKGFQVMRPSRNRYFGHPNLIAFVERLGRQASVQGQRLLIGDLSQPRGGPMNGGHRSHQIGLDVDIWFGEGPQGRPLSREETEAIPMLSVIQAAEGNLNPARWSARYRNALKLASEAPEVERIFVNPIIKQALCRSERDPSWLYKIRPWWGHDEHFHVRLRCPADNPLCRPQEPLPMDDGCDVGLERWVREIQMAAISSPSQKQKPTPEPSILPEICKAVLNGNSFLQPTRLSPPGS